eukprot:PhM_4_TR19051/c0_g1_i1/m.3010/K00948/PRPS, prsA; ribose-phosphate pyrophosphokinase
MTVSVLYCRQIRTIMSSPAAGTSPIPTPTSPVPGVSPRSVQPMSESYHFTKREKQAVETGYQVRLITGNSNPGLAAGVALCLQMDITPCRVSHFANGEIDVKINENIRGDDVFIIQSACANGDVEINTSLMELLLMIHTARLASAKRITAVVPYYAYSRQDRKVQSRVPISASAVAQLIQSMGVDRVLTVDLHCGQIQGFFQNLPIDNLAVYHEIVKHIMDQGDFDPKKTVIVSPDAGGVERATSVANLLYASHVVTILKRRVEAGKVDSMQTVGDVKGYTCYIVDDMIDTAGTLCKAASSLVEHGAKEVYAFATHGILTDPASSRITDCAALTEVVVTDTILQDESQAKCAKVKVLSAAPFLAEVVRRVHHEESFDDLGAQVAAAVASGATPNNSITPNNSVSPMRDSFSLPSHAMPTAQIRK